MPAPLSFDPVWPLDFAERLLLQLKLTMHMQILLHVHPLGMQRVNKTHYMQ